MKRLVLTLALVAIALPAAALSPKERALVNKELLKLTPETRAEQRCDEHASGIVGREHKGFKPDRTVAYAFADVKVKGMAVEAPGAALRSNGEWYRLTFHCRTSPDGLSIESFDYTLGDKVPRAQWRDHSLFD